MQTGHTVLHGARRALSVLGELLITFGVVLALFLVYEVWWTNVIADRQAAQAQEQLIQTWHDQPTIGAGAGAGASSSAGYTGGQALGILHVPAMGHGYSVVVEQGTGASTLNQGVAGHYPGTALPWDADGNVALAAHRDGHGAKFHNIDRIHQGDAIVFETRSTWYVYQVDNTLPSTSANDVGVIAPVPVKAGYTGPGHYITLTSCTPVYTSLHRIIVWGHLTQTLPVDAQRTPPAVLN